MGEKECFTYTVKKVGYYPRPGKCTGYTYGVIAPNGQCVAECKTEVMANKVAKGLGLYKDQERERRSFRL